MLDMLANVAAASAPVPKRRRTMFEEDGEDEDSLSDMQPEELWPNQAVPALVVDPEWISWLFHRVTSILQELNDTQ